MISTDVLKLYQKIAERFQFDVVVALTVWASIHVLESNCYTFVHACPSFKQINNKQSQS